MKFKIKNWLIVVMFCFCFFTPIFLSNCQTQIKKDTGTNLYLNSIDRNNKVFSNITQTYKNCYIDNKNPILSEQPRLYLPNNHLSYAKMNFENISALNYTKDIETEFSDSVRSSKNGSIYIYQKFYVRMSQYINNVSILIQDVNNKTHFTDENSWEVAIVNCLDDVLGTPNPNETLGRVQRPHPIKIYPQWITFDFKASENGPVYLNISQTKYTYEKGIDKYWFAFRVKIPPDDSDNGGGPKFLYFNLDGGDVDNIGAGDIFAQSPDFIYDNYTLNNVIGTTEEEGVLEEGGIDSFVEYQDGNYYLISDESDNVKFITEFNLKDLRNYEGTYEDLYNFANGFLGLGLFNWYFESYKYLFKIKISLALNVSNPEIIENATLYGFNNYANFGFGKWESVTHSFNLTDQKSTLIEYEIRDPFEKLQFLSFIDSDNNNSMLLRFEYLGTESFNVSIDKFTIEMGEIDQLPEIQKYDPLVEDLYKPEGLIIENDSLDLGGDYELEKLYENDDNYLDIQADTTNLTTEFNFKILQDYSSSLWDVNFYDWLVKYPYPYLPKMDVRISSNVSIENQNSLSHAILEIYKGDMDTGPFEEAFDALYPNQTWIPISDNKTYGHKDEKTIITELDPGLTWIFLQLLNESQGNLFRMRLRYVANKSQPFQEFNVSIDEVSFNIYLQNLISSDISSKIGFGVNNQDLTPEYIGLKNKGIIVQNLGFREGYWESEIEDGIPEGGYYEFDITSIWPFIKFDVDGTYEIFKIKPIIQFLTEFNSEYMTGSHLVSVNITDNDGYPIKNLKIYIQIIDQNDRVIEEFQIISDENGIASTSIDLSVVGDDYSIRVQCAEQDVYTISETYSPSFNVINTFTIFLDTMIFLTPFFIGALAAISVYLVIRHKKRETLREEWKKDAQILEDLLKLSYIMIIHKNIGVAIFSQQISSEKLDPDLISGFLHAISSFKREFKKNELPKEKKGFEMNYYDFHINITDGDHVRVALIAEENPSRYLKEQQTDFTKEFEKRYKNVITSFRGDTSVFSGANKLVEKYFYISLMYPLKTNPNINLKDLDKLEKDLLELANQIQKEKEYFFFSDLLSFGLVGRDEPRNKVISTIIGLKNENYLRSIKI